MDTNTNLKAIDWELVTGKMHENGYCLLPKLLNNDDCNELIHNYDEPEFYRKTIVMERYRFGLGEYKYFQYPLPGLIQSLRESIYPKLAKIANQWMQVLRIDKNFPDSFSELQKLCHDNNQTKPTVLILK